MVAPLEFRSRLPEMAGGREGVLALAREMLETTHRITKASDASKIPAPKVEEHVVGVIVEAIRAKLREPLQELLIAHLQAVQEEHELMEGEAPKESDPPFQEWLLALQHAQLAALAGETANTVGSRELINFVSTEGDTNDLAELMLAKVNDTDRAFEALGILPADIAALVEEVRTPPAKAPEPFGLKDIADLVRAALAADGDMLELDEAVRVMLSTQDPDEFDNVVAIFTSSHKLQKELLDFTNNRPVNLEQDALDADEIMRIATSTEPAPEKPAAAPKAARPGRPRGSRTDPSPRSEAARSILAVICDRTRITEAAIAEALGVSRAGMNNFRHGKAVFHPTTEQAAALGSMLAESCNALNDAQKLFQETFQ